MDMMEIRKNVLEASPHIETETGDYEGNYPAPLRSLKVGLEPIQDLHGYDAPWPSGGGKNLFRTSLEELKAINTSGGWNGNVYRANGISFTINDDGTIGISGTATGIAVLYIYTDLPKTKFTGMTFSLSAYGINDITGEMYVQASCRNQSDETVANRVRVTPNTTTATYAINSQRYLHDIFIRLSKDAVANNVVAKFQFEIGSTATSWSPYSNICPISGHDSVSVVRTGKNVLNLDTDVTVLVGAIPSAVTITSGSGWANITETYYNRDANKFGWKFDVAANTDYVISGNIQSTASTNIKIYSESGDVVYTTSMSANSNFTRTFNSGSHTKLYFYASISSWGQSISLTDTRIELGTTATTYEPYNGITVTVPFEDTVYGGTVDVVK